MNDASGVKSVGESWLTHFDTVRIINLQHRSDRRAEMRAELRRLNLEHHPRIAFHDASKFSEPDGFPTAGTRGCFHSHLAVLEEAVSSGKNSVLILEDDMDFDRHIEALLPPVAEALAAQDWSIFYGGVLQWEGLASASRPISVANPADSIMGGHFIAFRGAAIAAVAAYLRAMLERPAGSPDGGPMHVDGAYSWFRRAHPEFTTLIAVPELGHQRASRTDIHELRLLDRLPIVRTGVAILRKMKRRFSS